MLAVSTHLVPHQPQVAPHTPDAFSLFSIVGNFGHLHHFKKLFIKNKTETRLMLSLKCFPRAQPGPALPLAGKATRGPGVAPAAALQEEEEATSH